MHKNIPIILSISFITLLSFSCTKKEDPKPDTYSTSKSLFLENYANIALATYEDAVSEAQNLKVEIDAFISNPTQDGLDKCRSAWKKARVPYSQTEPFRFYGGPIDDPNTGPEGLINSWPMDESYLDYVTTNSTSGIINNPSQYPNITKDSIVIWNQATGEENVASGYHAIEFLLWGQDLSDTGPGNRPYTDYLASAVNGTRRGQYLKAVTELLIDNLTTVANGWKKDNSSNYRASFLKSDSNRVNLGLAKVLTGISKFVNGEFAGERLTTAYTNGEQEDEHDCFSDYTTTDIGLWQKGIENIYYGSYTRVDGTIISGQSLKSMIDSQNSAISDSVKLYMNGVDTKIAILTIPFDNAIKSGSSSRYIVGNIITALKEMGQKITDTVAALGITKEYNQQSI